MRRNYLYSGAIFLIGFALTCLPLSTLKAVGIPDGGGIRDAGQEEVDTEEDTGPSTGQVISQALLGIGSQILTSRRNKKDLTEAELEKLEKEYDKLVLENDGLRGGCEDKVLDKYPEVEGMGLSGGNTGLAGTLGAIVSGFAGGGQKDYKDLIRKYSRQNAALKSACKKTTSIVTTKKSTTKNTSSFSLPTFGSTGSATSTSKKKSTTTTTAPSTSLFNFGSSSSTTPKTTTPSFTLPKTTTPSTTTTPSSSSKSSSLPLSLPGLTLPSGSAAKGSLFDPKNFKED